MGSGFLYYSCPSEATLMRKYHEVEFKTLQLNTGVVFEVLGKSYPIFEPKQNDLICFETTQILNDGKCITMLNYTIAGEIKNGGMLGFTFEPNPNYKPGTDEPINITREMIVPIKRIVERNSLAFFTPRGVKL